jgi:hypothetical protein
MMSPAAMGFSGAFAIVGFFFILVMALVYTVGLAALGGYLSVRLPSTGRADG